MRRAIPLAVLLVLASEGAASAHIPRFLDATTRTPGTALVLPAADVSYAMYGRLSPHVRTAYVRLVAPTSGYRLPIQLIVPVTERAGVTPRRVALRGPHGYLRVMRVPVRPSGSFDEPITGTSYRSHLDLAVRLPRAGRYLIEVVGVQGPARAGRVRYVLSTGSLERFSAADVAALPAALARIRRWYSTP